MIRGYNPVVQAFLGSLLTWGLTALGAAGVFVLQAENRKLLDGSLGFAAGVMTAASFWSLLSPALEITQADYGSWCFVPVAFGFAAGAGFIYAADLLMPMLGVIDGHGDLVHALTSDQSFNNNHISESNSPPTLKHSSSTILESGVWLQPSDSGIPISSEYSSGSLKQRRGFPIGQSDSNNLVNVASSDSYYGDKEHSSDSWRRILLLLIAIVVHNIPEGLVVGVAFGAVGKSASATFESACTLAVGIGIQNFPEGLAVSLPLATFGFGKMKSFWYKIYLFFTQYAFIHLLVLGMGN